MKKLLVVSAIAALGLTSVALAGGLPEEMPVAPAAVSTSDTGIYLGIEGGWGLTNWKHSELVGESIGKDNGFVGRAVLGYDINRYFAIEAGYTYFFNKPQINSVDFVKRTQAIDLMVKVKGPVADNFDLYAKLGANYLMTSFETGMWDSRNNFNVAYGAGADYYITPNVTVNVEWLRFNGDARVKEMTKTGSYQPYTDAFMIGLRYRFDI